MRPSDRIIRGGMGNGEKQNALRDASSIRERPMNWSEWVRTYIKPADPSGFNWEYVMGPGDESPRLATKEEKEILGLKAPDLCVCGPTTVAEGLCECGALDEPLYRVTKEQIDEHRAKQDAAYALSSQGHPEYMKVLNERRRLHVEKSAGYGTGKDPFANFTAVAQMADQPRYLYPVHRTIEKLTRVLSLHSQGRTWELEEEFKDCSSLLDCATAMLREDTTKKSLELVRPCRHVWEVDGCEDCEAHRKG